jgi:hypothetical protein
MSTGIYGIKGLLAINQHTNPLIPSIPVLNKGLLITNPLIPSIPVLSHEYRDLRNKGIISH